MLKVFAEFLQKEPKRQKEELYQLEEAEPPYELLSFEDFQKLSDLMVSTMREIKKAKDARNYEKAMQGEEILKELDDTANKEVEHRIRNHPIDIVRKRLKKTFKSFAGKKVEEKPKVLDVITEFMSKSLEEQDMLASQEEKGQWDDYGTIEDEGRTIRIGDTKFKRQIGPLQHSPAQIEYMQARWRALADSLALVVLASTRV